MKRFLLLLALLLIGVSSSAQEAVIRVLSYNLLNYPGSSGPVRNPLFSQIIDEIDPDLIIAQEVTSAASADEFLENVLGAAEWSVNDPTNVGQSDEFIFYKHGSFELVSVTSIQTVLRNIELYEVRFTGLPNEPVIRFANAHLKASQGGDNEQQRLDEVNEFIDHMTAENLHGTDLIFGGDLNLYTSSEPAYQALLNDGDFEDPIDAPGNWHDNAGMAWVHTQSTRTTMIYGGATGGMDDRFDFLLAQEALFDGDGWDIMDGSYTAFGNDGDHFNTDINDGFNGAVSPDIADALQVASDHLPVFMDVGYYSGGPVTFALTPAVPEPVIFPSGGVVEYNALLINHTDGLLQGQAWTMVTLPNGNDVGPLQLVNLNLTPGLVIDVDQALNVPGFAPGGTYTFTAKLGYYPGYVALTDAFDFSKLGGAGSAARLKRAWLDGALQGSTLAGETTTSAQPDRFELARAYPNPFNGRTTLELTLPESRAVRLVVTDVTGRQVLQQNVGTLGSGRQELTVDLSGHASGLYFARVQAGAEQATTKLMLVR